MKQKLMVFLMAAFLILSGGAFSAQADTVQNFTNYKVEEYRWTSPSGGGWKDVVGNAAEFATPNASVTWGVGGDVTFDIYTNYPSSGIAPAGVGVLALDLDHNGSFEKGIVMDVAQGKAYLSDVSNWKYSTETVFNNGGYYYGGMFDQSNPRPIPVGIDAGTSVGEVGTVTWSDIAGTNPNYMVTLVLAGVNAGGAYNNFNWQQSISTCGNVSIGGHAQNPVPIPPSVLLLGTGLVGLVGLKKWHRRGQNAS